MGLRVAVCFALSACNTTTSQLVVLVDSDIPNLEAVTLRIVDADNAHRVVDKRIPLTGQGALRVPFSIGVAPPKDDPRREVVITGDAVGPGVRVRRIARVGFVRGATILVRLSFRASCADVVCAAETTCEEGACIDVRLEAEDLERIDPGSELPDVRTADAGLRDAQAADAGPADTGPPDAGPADTGPADTGPADTGPPDGGDPECVEDFESIVDRFRFDMPDRLLQTDLDADQIQPGFSSVAPGAAEGKCGTAIRMEPGQFLELQSGAFDGVGSLSFWLRIESWPDETAEGADRHMGIFSHDATNPANGHVTLYLTSRGALVMRAQSNVASGYRCTEEARIMAGDDWTHILMNFGPPAYELWVDGVRVGPSEDRAPIFTDGDCNSLAIEAPMEAEFAIFGAARYSAPVGMATDEEQDLGLELGTKLFDDIVFGRNRYTDD